MGLCKTLNAVRNVKVPKTGTFLSFLKGVFFFNKCQKYKCKMYNLKVFILDKGLNFEKMYIFKKKNRGILYTNVEFTVNEIEHRTQTKNQERTASGGMPFIILPELRG